jgi:phage tail sheath protein FI
MPVRPTFPGVYIEEIPSGVRPITAVATSTAAFIGTFRKGLIDEAVRLLSIADFEREYGGLERSSEASYAVQQFFLNGGTEAWVVRIGQPTPPAAPATESTAAANGTINDAAATAVFNFRAGRRIRGASADNPGNWGNFLRLEVEHNGNSSTSTFNLFVSEVAISGNRTTVLQTETFRNLTMTPNTANNALEVVNQGSRLIQLNRDGLAALPVPPAAMIKPVASGTMSGDLPAAFPAAIANIDDISVILSAAQSTPAPIALTIPATVYDGFTEWAAALETAIQAAGADASVLPEHVAYFTDATVVMNGTGAVGDPHRLLVTPGVGTASNLPALFEFSGTHAVNYGLDPPLSVMAAGIESNDLPSAAVPAAPNLDTIEISLVLPIALAIPATAANGFVEWAAGFQAALRAAGTQAFVRPEHRAYFTGATVDLVGDGSADNPRRFVVRAGKGAQPYDPTATFTFAGADVANYLLASPVSVGPQQNLPTAGSGTDGTIVDATGTNYLVPAPSFRGNSLLKTGLYAIDDMDLVNIIAMPDVPRIPGAGPLSVYAEAITYAESRRSMIIVDIPDNVVTIDQMQTWLAGNSSLRHPNSAVYYPRTFTPDPLNQNRQRSLASSGTIGGLWARTDTARGVWKAPAGTDARLRNVESLTYVMTDLENGTLNPLGVNCLRNFPVYSNICWGARTLDGADVIASDWKYVPVRRTTLFIEESLYRGTKWVVFEPNDEPLWSQIRLNVGAFMQDLFRKGAFQGTTPRDAYFVKCDGETTTQTNIDNGIVNIEVGFAPLKPAEFVIIKIQQIARVTAE